MKLGFGQQPSNPKCWSNGATLLLTLSRLSLPAARVSSHLGNAKKSLGTTFLSFSISIVICMDLGCVVGVAVVAKRTLHHGIHAHEKASSIAPLKSSCRATWLQTQIEFGSNWARPSGIRHEIVLPVDPWARKQL